MRSTPAVATSSSDDGGGRGVTRSSSEPHCFGAPERFEAAAKPGLAWKIVTLPISVISGSQSLISGAIWAVCYRPRQRAIDLGSSSFLFCFLSGFSDMFWFFFFFFFFPGFFETLDSFFFSFSFFGVFQIVRDLRLQFFWFVNRALEARFPGRKLLPHQTMEIEHLRLDLLAKIKSHKLEMLVNNIV